MNNTRADISLFHDYSRNGESWKELRSDVGKQIMPRNVQMWSDVYNNIINQFTHYTRSSKDTDGTIEDISYPLQRLVIECK